LNTTKEEPYKKKKTRFTGAVVTVSDRSYRGERADISGEVACSILADAKIEVVRKEIVPDDLESIKSILLDLCEEEIDLIVTSGGTGVSPRDVTPEATLAVIDRQIPGMSEAMRAESLKVSPHAMISRAVCGMRGKTFIVNLPGSPSAVRDCLKVAMKAIPHALRVATGEVVDCSEEED